jgi:hypothetical protein
VSAGDVAAYRAAVADLALELAGLGGPDGAAKAETILAERLTEPEFDRVLSSARDGLAGAMRRLAYEIRDYRPIGRSSPANLAALIRIYLLAQIDTAWWRNTPTYVTDADVTGAADLVDLDVLDRRSRLCFRYRRQANRLVTRAARAAERRMWPNRRPHTAGLKFTHARPEVVALLNQVARDLVRTAPPGTPPLWVTSLARSLRHQHRLRELGYAAMLPSAHCVGYAADVEISWFRRYDAHDALRELLLERQNAGQANVIDEGQAWHVCVNPAASSQLRRAYRIETGG